ncbi:DUF3500 domain-containing protein [Streptomyces sp. NPDC047081]|uniref:DUF3500 domain-containing protein n=1 Tax=Streptomyces sp. NPDC047081 TaxID=3154706 RepID=UPI0033EF3C1A
MAELRPRDGGGTHPPMWTIWSPERAVKVERMHRKVSEQPFQGIRGSDRAPVAGLFSADPTGADTRPARRAVLTFLESLTVRQAAQSRFPIDHGSWHEWMNGSRFYGRHGQCLEDLDDQRRELALEVVRASLSKEGFGQLLDCMHLNRTIGELRDELDVLNEWLYWFSVYGSPERPDEPWGWQLDGHHLAVNCVLAGDRMTLTPTFLGAEPVVAEGGRYAGTRLFEPEESTGSRLFTALTPEQRDQARIADTMPPDLITGAYRDNALLDPVGLSLADMSRSQREIARDLIGLYVNRAPDRHAGVRTAEIRAHERETYFSFIGDDSPGGAFYYRVHSPVVLVEFEHMASVMFDVDEPWRNHVHTVVRTPNGGDYGKDLLRQHHERHHRRGLPSAPG